MTSRLPTETYRITDPIERLQLCVTLRKRATDGERRLRGEQATEKRKRRVLRLSRASAKAAGAASVDGDDKASAASDDDADGSDAGGEEDVRAEREEEEQLLCPPRTFKWQEKAFSRQEVRRLRALDQGSMRRRQSSIISFFAGSEASDAPQLSNHLRAEFERLDSETRAADGSPYEGEMIYTRVNAEQYSDLADWAVQYTDSASETLTPLARAVLTGSFVKQHRDMLGEAACVSMHVLATIPADDDQAAAGRRRSSFGGARFSLVPGSRSADEPEANLGEEVTLCVLRLYPAGRLDIRPPLSVETSGSDDGDRLARWYAIPGTRYEYKLENLAEPQGAAAAEQEAIAERLAKQLSVASGPAAPGRAMAELDFSSPARRAARVHYFIQLDSATAFSADVLFVAYYALAAPGWTLMPNCQATAVTQVSYVRGADERAVFGFPIELVLESDGPPTSARPPLSLFFSVTSRDLHERMTQLGYAHCAPPAEAGGQQMEVQAWRLAETRVDALRRFFVGGAEELADLRALSLPDALDMSQPQVLNKHGLQTISSGSLQLTVHTVIQQHQPALAKGPARPAALAKIAEVARRPPDLGALRGVVGVSTLARSETAADRVLRRLEERRRAEAA